MLQTDRRTEASRQTSQDRDRAERRQAREDRTEAALALEAILNGGSWEQLPAEGVLALSRTVGNDALLSVLTLRETGPETATGILPSGACLTAPGDWGGGEPLTAEAPAFGPVGETAPMAL